MKQNNILRNVLTGILSLVLLVSNVTPLMAENDTDQDREDVIVENSDDKKPQDEIMLEVGEVLEERTEYSSTVLNKDGTYTISLFSEPIRYFDENNILKDIDLSLEEIDSKTIEESDLAEGYTYQTIDSPVDIFLPEEVSVESPVVLELEKYRITITPITEKSVKKGLKDNKSEGRSKSDFEGAGKSKGKVEKEMVEDLKGNRQQKNTKLKYNAFSDTKTKNNTNAIEIEYQPTSFGIKENIIINQNIGINRFDFMLTVSGYDLQLTDYGAIILQDEKTKKDIGVIPVPMVYDVNEEEHENYDVVHYELNELDDGYILSIIVDKEYLDSEDRVYPVIIDPTISMKNSDVQEAYVLSNYSSTNFYSPAVSVSRIGYDPGFKKCRTYMRFPNLQSQLTSNKIIIDATLHAKVNYVNSKAKTEIYRVTGSWKASEIKWSNQPTTVDDVKVTPVAMSSGTKKFNITKLVQGWAKGSYPNYGICLRATVESGSTFANFYGSRHGTSSVRPHLEVTYVNAPAISATIAGAGKNTQRNKISVSIKYNNGLTPLSGDLKGLTNHYLLISPTNNINDAKLQSFNISGSLKWSDSSGYPIATYVTSALVIAGGTGLPDNPTKVFGSGATDYYVAVKTTDSNGLTTVTSGFTKLTPIDQTAPTPVNKTSIKPQITHVVGSPDLNGVNVSFNGTTDDKSGIEEYVVTVVGTTGVTYPKITLKASSGVNNVYSTNIKGLDLYDPYLNLSITAIDKQGNDASTSLVLDINRPTITVRNIEEDSYIEEDSNYIFTVKSRYNIDEVKLTLSNDSSKLVLYQNRPVNIKDLIDIIVPLGDLSSLEDGAYCLELEVKSGHATSIDYRKVLLARKNYLSGDIINIEDNEVLSGVKDVLLNVDGSYYYDSGSEFFNLDNLRDVGFSFSVYKDDILIKELTTAKTIYVFDTTLIPNGEYQLVLYIYDNGNDDDLTITKDITIHNEFRKFDFLDWRKTDNQGEIKINLGYSVLPLFSNEFYYEVNDDGIYHEIPLALVVLKQMFINDSLLILDEENVIKFYHLGVGDNQNYDELGSLIISLNEFAPQVNVNSVTKINDVNKLILDLDVSDESNALGCKWKCLCPVHKKLHPHKGIDIKWDGDKKKSIRFNIYAVAYGKISIEYNGNGKNLGWGKTIVLKSGHIWYRYCHFKSILVKNKVNVKAGDLIGIMGGTGGNYAPHLHFETLVNKKKDGKKKNYKKKDPLKFLKGLGYK